jgi:hypothetical protein
VIVTAPDAVSKDFRGQAHSGKTGNDRFEFSDLTGPIPLFSRSYCWCFLECAVYYSENIGEVYADLGELRFGPSAGGTICNSVKSALNVAASPPLFGGGGLSMLSIRSSIVTLRVP